MVAVPFWRVWAVSSESDLFLVVLSGSWSDQLDILIQLWS